MRVFAAVLLCACGGSEAVETAAAVPVPPVATPPASAAPASTCARDVPRAACLEPGVHVCGDGEAARIGEWRYALVGGPFEPTQDVSRAQLTDRWRRGEVGASDETAAALARTLGDRAATQATGWTIVPAHELSPRGSIITVDRVHPLTGGDGALVIPLCGRAGAVVRNIDPARLTTVVMSGTTALTGRTAKRIDDTGAADTVRFIKPFFTSADFTHISNEVSFVRDCHPQTGQVELVFCARRSAIAVLEALGTDLVELTGSHLVDYGQRSLSRTIDMYAQRGWIWFGGGRTQIDATEPRLLEHHGNKLAFVGCNAVAWWIKGVRSGPGVAGCDWARMTWQLQDLRRRGYLPIATVQHRELRTHAPPPDLVRDLRRLAEAGAMFVLGSQAHVAHPWDVHHGAYIHYGPGNILFAQSREVQREASVDKLYIHAGKLLAVGHIFTRTEHGRPRLLDDRERARFLGELAAAAAAIAPPAPDAPLVLPDPPRTRPDSVAVGGRNQPLAIAPPAQLDHGVRYPLVIDLTASTPPDPAAFVVARAGTSSATALQIADFMRAKYPIDPGRVSIVPTPTRRELRAHRRAKR